MASGSLFFYFENKTCVAAWICWIFDFCVPSVWAQDMDISAKSAILMCADSCSVLWSKNETEPLPMASTTKIMTALLALEAMRATKNKEVEISEEMVKVEGTSMGLRAGDIVDLTSLAQGMLL